MKYSPQATIRLEEGDLFQALLKECKKIENEEIIENDFDGNPIITTPLELGGEVIGELSEMTIHSDGSFNKEEWITLFLG